MRQIAIVGLAPSTHDQAPWSDPNWELWGLPQDHGYWLYHQVLFEVHDRRDLEAPHIERCRDFDGLIYMQQAWMDIPGSVPYPLKDLRETVFRDFPRWDQSDWYDSTIAFMLALAIHKNMKVGDVTKVGLWGIDMDKDTEHDHQLPNMSFLIGVALGVGLEIYLPQGPTALCQFRQKGDSYRERYGWR